MKDQGLSDWIKKGRYTESSNDFDDYVVEISPIFNYVNKKVGANLTIMKRNKDRTLTILKLLSHYKTYNEAKKDVEKQIANL